MTKPYIALIAFISLVASAFGASDLSDKVKEAENIKKQEKTISPDGKLWKRVPSYLADDAKLDDDLRNEMQEYLMNNKQVSLKDFSKARLLGNISSILLTDFNRRFGATPVNYQTKIANEREKIIYKIASVVRPTLLYIWPPWTKSVPRVQSIQTPEDFGYGYRYSS